MKDNYKLAHNTSVYMTPEMFAEHAVEIEACIEYLFKHCKNLSSLDFSDVSAGGVQLGGVHNMNPGYIYMSKTIKYDWSNFNDIIKEFIKDWNGSTNEQIENFKKFIKDGEKYGWD